MTERDSFVDEVGMFQDRISRTEGVYSEGDRGIYASWVMLISDRVMAREQRQGGEW